MVISRGTGRIPVMGHRILMNGDHGKDVSGGEDVCFEDMVFGFLEEGEGCMDSSISSGGSNSIEDFDDDDEQENSGDVEKSKAFWESQHQLLQGTLSRTSSLETKIRKATREALRESQLQGVVCVCRKPVSGCRSCLLRDISDRLRRAGIECGICKAKWKSSPDIPAAGEHTYLDVVDKTSLKKGDEIRVIIELNFRAEFEMARANEEYNKLISRLPEVFVGKAERLKSAIKILCTAAKKCMKENKMHMGPWRKHKYMQAKWFGTCERTLSEPLQKRAVNRPKPRASMLTFEMVDKLPSMQHFTAVEVV